MSQTLSFTTRTFLRQRSKSRHKQACEQHFLPIRINNPLSIQKASASTLNKMSQRGKSLSQSSWNQAWAKSALTHSSILCLNATSSPRWTWNRSFNHQFLLKSQEEERSLTDKSSNSLKLPSADLQPWRKTLSRSGSLWAPPWLLKARRGTIRYLRRARIPW